MKKVRKNSEKGVTDMIVMIFVLPIALLLFAALVDLSRVPIMKNRLLSALYDGAYNAEKTLATTAGNTAIDSYTPAAHNFCELTSPSGDCKNVNSGTFQSHGFLTPQLAQEFSSAAANAFTAALSEGSNGLLSVMRPTQQAVCYRVYEFPVVGGSGAMIADPQPVGLEGCGGSTPLVSLGRAESGLDTNIVLQRLHDHMMGAGPGAAAWYVQDDFDARLTSDWATVRAPWISSYWLVGVAYFEVDFLFGKFFGTKKIVADYFVRPLNNPAGIQLSGT